jgi:hypothetical protein
MSQSIQPPNYLANLPNPQQSFVQGLQLGQGVVNMQQEQQSQEQMRQALGELAANPTTENITRAMIRFPSIADKLKEPLTNATETERTGRISSAMPIYAALASGNADMARERLLEMATAAENSGRTGEARRFRTLADTARINPGMAMFEIGGVLAANMGPDKFFETFKGFSTLPSTVQREQATATTELPLRQAQVRNAAATATTQEATAGVAPEAAAADVEKKNAEIEQIRANISDKQGDIPESARTIVNQTATEAWTARSGAQRAGDLAQRFSQTTSGGQFGRAWDALASSIGSTTQMAQLRQQFERELTSQVLASLPPGALSNAEQDQIRKGFPKNTDSAESITAYLRTVQKAYQMQEVFADIRGQWAAANGMSGPARRDFTIEGIEVPRGTTFLNFSRSYVGLARDRLAAQESEAFARSRGYGRVLQAPAPGQSSPNNGRVLPETGP